jgi:hypothetical protein
MEDDPVIDEALAILHQIFGAMPFDPIGGLAAALGRQIERPIGAARKEPQREATEKEKRKKELEKLSEIGKREDRELFVAEAAAIIERKREPAYKTAVFKCLEDYEKCKEHSSPRMCAALMAICVGRQLIPFIK